MQRRHVRRDLASWYAVPLLPMGVVGLAFAARLPTATLTAAIGVSS